MAQINPHSSRAIAVTATVLSLPLRVSARYRALRRHCAFQAISPTACGATATLACFRSTGSRELAHRLVPLVGDPHRCELPGAQLPGQADRITPVRLHPITRLLRNKRRRNNNARISKAGDLPIQPIAGRPRLITKRQPLVLGGKPPHQLRRRRPAVVDLTNEPDLPPPGRPPQSPPHCATSTYRKPQKLRYSPP